MGPKLIRLVISTTAVAILLLVSFDNNSLLWSSMQNAGHFLLFTVLTFNYLTLFKRDSLHQPLKHAAAVLALLCLGAMVEGVQSTMPDRTASWNDLLLDAAGIVMGYLIFLLTRYHRSLSTVNYAALAVCGLTTGFLATQPALQTGGYYLLKTGLPVVISFNDPLVKAIISSTGGASVEVTKTRHSQDSEPTRLLRINFAHNNHYNGVVFKDIAKRWTGAEYLVFELQNNSDLNREIALRIHDSHHNNDYGDRYNTTLFVKPGTSSWKLPISHIQQLHGNEQADRQLDMENIQEIQFFADGGSSFFLLLSDLRLTS